jgi:hypothetical protein
MKKFAKQKGLSIMEAVTASGVLAIAVIVFMTLQANQEESFTNLRKFDRSAYTVELMFEEMAAVYNPVAVQYGEPRVFETKTALAGPNTTLKVKGLKQLPDQGDVISIEGVGGSYRIISSPPGGSPPTHNFNSDEVVTFTIERSDIPTSVVNKSLASNANENAPITFRSNAEGSLDPYHNLDLSKFDNTDYLTTVTNEKVKLDLQNWGNLLSKILGPVRSGDQRTITVEEVDYDTAVDLNNDGVQDVDSDNNPITEKVTKKQVTITITQSGVTERFRRLFLAGT